jgi:hypothetical protein
MPPHRTPTTSHHLHPTVPNAINHAVVRATAKDPKTAKNSRSKPARETDKSCAASDPTLSTFVIHHVPLAARDQPRGTAVPASM